MKPQLKPSTLSRRGFLRALGITATTVLLGDVVKVEAAPLWLGDDGSAVRKPPKFLHIDWISFASKHDGSMAQCEGRVSVDGGKTYETIKAAGRELTMPLGAVAKFPEDGMLSLSVVNENDEPVSVLLHGYVTCTTEPCPSSICFVDDFVESWT